MHIIGNLLHYFKCPIFQFLTLLKRPTNKATVENKGQGNQNAGKSLEVGIADDQAKDFDFEKTEMKYDSTGMFHWTPARSIEDCILDRNQVVYRFFS